MPEHPGSRDTYDTIAQWITPDLAYSTRDRFDRYGMLGYWGEYVLSCTQGAVCEIGVGESSIYLSKVARKYDRQIYHCDISPSKIVNPLTIPGYISQDSDEHNYMEEGHEYEPYRRIICYAGPSDLLFERLQPTELALSYIDGDHCYAQARKDFDHLFARTVDDGYILLHDTYPPDATWVHANACGDVYQLRQELEQRTDLDCLTLTRGTAIGVGLTMIRKRPRGYQFQ
jgi:hypothetical protein